MNYFIKSQIQNMTNITKTFLQSCQMAALQDDGVRNRAEEKQLQQIEKAAKKFIETLQAIE